MPSISVQRPRVLLPALVSCFGLPGLLLGLAELAAGCSDHRDVPAKYRRRIVLPKQKKRPPPMLPPMSRPVVKKKTETVEEIATRECKDVYKARQASRAQIVRLLAKSGKKLPPMPTEERFVSTCRRMPLSLVRCMNPGLRQTAALDCVKVIGELDKTQLDQLRRLTRRGKKKRRRRRR